LLDATWVQQYDHIMRIHTSICAILLLSVAAGGILIPADPAIAGTGNRLIASAPRTTAVVTTRGARVAGFFDGMRPDPRFTVRSMLAHRHPPSACQPRSGMQSLSWIDRLLGVKLVHAQSGCMGGGDCTGAYWYSVEYTCQRNLPAGCTGATLQTSAYGGSAYNMGFCSCCMYCPKPNGCGQVYPICNNGAT